MSNVTSLCCNNFAKKIFRVGKLSTTKINGGVKVNDLRRNRKYHYIIILYTPLNILIKLQRLPPLLWQ